MLCVILGIACLFRIVLITSGGQFFWPDESRYEEAREIVAHVAGGRFGEAFTLVDQADHPLFRIIGAVPATMELVSGPSRLTPAFFFGTSSVLAIWLIWAIERRLGSTSFEALAAAGLLALSSTFSYYSRHLVPYDVAMALGLLALFIGVHPRPSRRRSFSCGLVASCAFLTYEGYWTLAGVAVLIHVIGGWPSRGAMGRAWFSLSGLVLPWLLAMATSAAFGGRLASGFLEFAQSATQGRFEEGWRLPFEYLWHAEHLLLVIWGAALVWSLSRLVRGRPSRQIQIGVIGLCVIYGAFVATSNGLHLSVVYGRLARQLVPFFCVITAHWLAHLRATGGMTRAVAVPAIGVIVCAQAAMNLREPLVQVFPDEFRRQAQVLVRGLEPSDYAFINAEFFYPAPEAETTRRYRTLSEAKHPMEFLPYQYEAFDPSQRQTLRSSDLRMRLALR